MFQTAKMHKNKFLLFIFLNIFEYGFPENTENSNEEETNLSEIIESIKNLENSFDILKNGLTLY